MQYTYYDCLDVAKNNKAMRILRRDKVGGIVCFLGQVFKEAGTKVTVSTLLARIAQFQNEYAEDDDYPLGATSPQDILADFCSEKGGILRRWFPADEDEAYCELTPASETVLKIYNNLSFYENKIGTETTFDASLHHLSHAVKFCDADPAFKLEQLRSDIERLNNEIEMIENGHFQHDYDRARSEFRQFKRLMEELRSEFKYIEKKYREQLEEAISLFVQFDEETGDKNAILDRIWDVRNNFSSTKEAISFEHFFAMLEDPVLQKQYESKLDYLLRQEIIIGDDSDCDELSSIFSRLAAEAYGPLTLMLRLRERLWTFMTTHNLVEDKQLRDLWQSISQKLIARKKDGTLPSLDEPFLEYDALRPEIHMPAVYQVKDYEKELKLKDTPKIEQPDLSQGDRAFFETMKTSYVENPLEDIIRAFHENNCVTMTFAELMSYLKPRSINVVLLYLKTIHNFDQAMWHEDAQSKEDFMVTYDDDLYQVAMNRIYVTLPQKYREEA